MIHASFELLLAMLGVQPDLTHHDNAHPALASACGTQNFPQHVLATLGNVWSTKEDRRVIDCERCLVLIDLALGRQSFPLEVAWRLQQAWLHRRSSVTYGFRMPHLSGFGQNGWKYQPIRYSWGSWGQRATTPDVFELPALSTGT